MILSYGQQYYSFSSKQHIIAQRVSIERSRIKMAVGDDYELKVGISPSNAEIGELKVSSSNRKVATVDEYGVITAKRLGTATISVKLTGKNTVKCKVTVDTQHVYLVENQKATIKFAPEVKKKWK